MSSLNDELNDELNAPPDAPVSQPLSLKVRGLPDSTRSDLPRFTPVGDGLYEANYPDIELDDLSPAMRGLVGDNLQQARQMLFWAPDAIQGDLSRAALANMNRVRDLSSTAPVPGPEDLAEMSAKAGMTEEEAKYWMERDPKYIANQTADNEILRLVGPDGYTAQQMQQTDAADRIREDAVSLAQAEAWMLGTWADGVGGALARAGYDLRTGIGQVGVFGLKAASGLTRAADDIVQGGEGLYSAFKEAGLSHEELKAGATVETNSGLRPFTSDAMNYVNEAVKDAEAGWLGPEIDTGSPTLDRTRSALLRGAPFLAGSVTLAAIPGVGPTGAATVIGGGMGLETYSNLRDSGVEPGLAAASAGATAVTSIFLNRFQLDRWTRNLMGRSPFGRFSVGAAVETTQEAISEFGESLGQNFFEASAKLIGADGYTRDQWWRDMKSGTLDSFQEGAAAGALSLASRFFGLPGAARAQARSYVAADRFQKTQNQIGETKLYQSGQDAVVADHLNMAAKQHGGAGTMFVAVQDLEQSGLTTSQIIEGLGVSESDYAFARDNNVDLAVPYGNAAVFAKRQADEGNTLFQGIFRADPDALTGRDIVEQHHEMSAVLEQAEVNFKVMEDADNKGVPLRIKIFRSGLLAGGFDKNEADASASLFWARAQRAAVLWGKTPEQWLEDVDVQLEMDNAVRTNQKWRRYEDLIAQSRNRHAVADHYVSPDVEVARNSGQDIFVEESTPESPTVETAAQQDIAGIVEPVVTADDNQQWIAEAAENIVDAANLPEEAKPAALEAAREIVAATQEIPEARELAEQFGLTSPAEAAPAAAPENPAGRASKVIFPAESGMPPIPARYTLVELDSLQPSHVFRNYTPNPAWTSDELAQQRNYDSGAMEAVRQGMEIEPLNYDAVFNPGTDAINGPPIVTADGKVLGGNNRSHRIYNRYQADNYRDSLIWHLSTGENLTGIKPEAALAMKSPVLVRVADGVESADIPGLIGALNADFTNRRDPANLAANRGMRVGDKTLASFAGIGDQSVAGFLDSPRTARRVLQAMVDDGALQSTDLPSLYDFANDKWLGDGRSSGKAQVEQALFGSILPDSRLLDNMSDGMKKKLARALPSLIRLKRNNAPELNQLFEAVALHNDFQAFKESPQAKGLKPAATLELFRKPTQADLFTGQVAEEKSGPAWDMFLELNAMRTQKDVADYFTRKADEIAGVGRGLFDLAQSPIEELYQAAYHGSPHRFDRFSLNAIGTGEGAQAYGWGLYFADNREISEWYRERLANIRPIIAANGNRYIKDYERGGWIDQRDNSILDPINNAHGIALELVHRFDLNYAKQKIADAIGDFKENITIYEENPEVQDEEENIDSLKQKIVVYEEAERILETVEFEKLEEKGQLYKVDIPENDVLLNWDTPLSEQSEVVKKALREIADSLPEEAIADLGGDVSLLLNPDMTGEDVYGTLLSLSGIGNDKEASLLLNEHGVSGIRYLDANSRHADEKNYNYVIFDDNAIEIMETYYQGDLNSPRGNIRFQSSASAPTIIRIFENADVSTVIHELNHLFVFDLQKMVAAGRGGEQARSDLAALSTFAGGKFDRAGYEKIAEAWERYAMDGRAPSPELYDAFDTFRTYISRIYSQATQHLNVEPSPEVRAVFDRFLATDQQIADAREIEAQSEYWFDQAKDMDEATKERLRTLNRRLDGARRKDMDAKSGGGKALNKLNERRAAIRGEAANPPAYRAISRAKTAGGFNRADVEAYIGTEGAAEIARRHGDDIFGGDADISGIAEAAGYQTIEEMFADIAGIQPVETKAAADLEAELSLEEEAESEVDEAEGLGPSDETAEIEEEGIVEQIVESIKAAGGNARHLREFRVKYTAMKAAAQKLVGAKALREAVDLRPFQKAKRAASKKALEAAKKGKLDDITKNLNLELMHHLTVRECVKARDLREWMKKECGTRALLGKIQGKEHQAKIENEYAEAIKAMATFVGLTKSRHLRPQVNGEVIPFPTYEANSNVAEFLPDIAGSVEPWLLNKVYPNGYQDWRDFTVDQLHEVKRVMQLLLQQGSGQLSAIRDLDVRNLQELVEKSTASMARRESVPGQRDDRTAWTRALNRINDFLISITIPENWFMAMDGNPTISGQESGINQKMFWKMRDCQLAKDKLYKDLIGTMQPHFDQLAKAKRDLEARFGATTFVVPNLNMQEVLRKGRDYSTWDVDTLLSICLNMGNDANLYRLTGILKGRTEVDYRENAYNFSEQDLAHIAALFDADTWRAIQGIWDGIGSLYQQLDDVTYRITNRHVVKEPSQPLTVTTSDGAVLALKGGYFPAVNDPYLSDRAAQLKEGSGLEDAIHAGIMGNIHQSTKPAAGMTKERLRDEDGNPVVRLPQILKSNIVTSHIEAATHYISHAETILEFDRLTRDQKWREAYTDKFGQAQYHAVRNWVQNLARPNRLDNSAGAQFMEKMRTLATVNALGLRFKTGLKQRQGYAQAINFMTDASRTGSSGWKWMKAGWRDFGFMGNIIGRNQEKVDWVNGMSDYMRARQGGHDRELRAQMEKLNPLKTEIAIPGTDRTVSKRRLYDFMFAWIQANDTAAAYAAWIGGFKQAMAGEANFDIAGMTNEQIRQEAIRYADSVAATQASSFAADLTEIQRNTGIQRFLSMFMSGNVRQGSRLMQYLDAYQLGDKTKGDIAWLAFREFAAPALAWVTMGAALKAMIGDDDDDDLMTSAVWEVAETAIAPFPLIRETTSALRYGSARVPAVEGPTKALGKIAGSAGKVAEGKYLKAVSDVMSGFGFFVGVPIMNPVNEAKSFLK